MRLLIQRVSEAGVSIGGSQKAGIGKGLLVLAGIGQHTTDVQMETLCRKLLALRIFSDAAGQMNLNVQQVSGDILLISQFTLYASTHKGNRPSFTDAAPPAVALEKFNRFHQLLEQGLGRPVGTGEFGEDMQVALVNDGPVTIWMGEE